MLDIALRLAAQFAPGLISRLAGEDSAAAKVAETIFSMGGLITGGATPEEIAERLEADVGMQQQFRMQAATIEFELAQLDHRNTSDARARDVAMMQSGRVNTRADVLAYGSVVALLVLVVLILKETQIDDYVKGVIATVIGVLACAVRDVFNFEFGSSAGSKDKAAQIDRLIGGRDRNDPD